MTLFPYTTLFRSQNAGFLAAEEMVSGAGMARVAKLVDAYLAEAALDAGLSVKEFEELARALPAHARATDDGLYRALDTFLKASYSLLLTPYSIDRYLK